jgi:pimeloyl-ACP methyl ester carboxylesterase
MERAAAPLAGAPRRGRAAKPAPAEFRRGDFLSISKQHFHRVAYTEWGDPKSARVLICVHGLSRQGRDFDFLAADLAARGYRVVCPDLVGRGRSGRLSDPEDYALPQYAVDMTMLIARLGVDEVDWVGTSLGGLVGMVLAGLPQSPIRRFVINDIGPYLPWAALRRIGDNVRAAPPDFPDLDAAEAYFRDVHAPFGDLSARAWRHLAEHSVAKGKDGRLHMLFDPGIGEAFRPGRVYNVSMWGYWDAIRCPTLVLRGETSDLLLEETAVDMAARGPHADLIEIEGCGHAPALMDEPQIELVRDWLVRAG